MIHSQFMMVDQVCPIAAAKLSITLILVFKSQGTWRLSFLLNLYSLKHNTLIDSATRSKESQSKGLDVKMWSIFDLHLTSVAFFRPGCRIFQWIMFQKIQI